MNNFQIEPSWRPTEYWTVLVTQTTAFNADSLNKTYAMNRKVNNPSEITISENEIVYYKSEAFKKYFISIAKVLKKSIFLIYSYI